MPKWGLATRLYILFLINLFVSFLLESKAYNGDHFPSKPSSSFDSVLPCFVQSGMWVTLPSFTYVNWKAYPSFYPPINNFNSGMYHTFYKIVDPTKKIIVFFILFHGGHWRPFLKKMIEWNLFIWNLYKSLFVSIVMTKMWPSYLLTIANDKLL